jgi:hypothetical protein
MTEGFQTRMSASVLERTPNRAFPMSRLPFEVREMALPCCLLQPRGDQVAFPAINIPSSRSWDRSGWSNGGQT